MMTVIAWDGKTLAADRQGESGGLKSIVTKIFKLETGEIVGITGYLSEGLATIDWYKNGAKPDDYPISKDSGTSMVVIKDGVIHKYEDHYKPLIIRNSFYAFGSGRELAIGAMAMGADAEQEVEIACQYESGCGMGIDVLEP